MVTRLALLIVLIAAIVAVSVVFARPLLGLRDASPSPTARPSATLAAASPGPTAARPATTAPATASPSPTPTRSPTASCPPVPAGGREAFHALTDVRVGHQPGFDRVVFEFGQEASARDDIPAFRIARASSFTAISGQPVPVQGNARWSVRFEPASIADQSGTLVYKGPRDIDPTTALVRDVKLVEDFEAVMVWGVGLAQLECPRVTTLRSPLRLVVDFPQSP